MQEKASFSILLKFFPLGDEAFIFVGKSCAQKGQKETCYFQPHPFHKPFNVAGVKLRYCGYDVGISNYVRW